MPSKRLKKKEKEGNYIPSGKLTYEREIHVFQYIRNTSTNDGMFIAVNLPERCPAFLELVVEQTHLKNVSASQMGTKISQTFRVEKIKNRFFDHQPKSLRGNAKNILPIGFTPQFAHESPLNPALFTHLRLFLLFLLYVEQGPLHVEAHQRQGGRDH